MKPEDIAQKSNELSNRMNKITKQFAENNEMMVEMETNGDELVDLVSVTIDASDKSVSERETADKLMTPTEALNLSMLIDDFKYVRTTLKTNADEGRRIITNVTLSILDFDEECELADKALLINAFAEVNKSIAVNMDLYLKTYKEIAGILVQLDKIKDTTEKITGEKTERTEKVINTSDLISSLNEIQE